jgi:hypothetical protein
MLPFHLVLEVGWIAPRCSTFACTTGDLLDPTLGRELALSSPYESTTKLGWLALDTRTHRSAGRWSRSGGQEPRTRADEKSDQTEVHVLG